METEPYSCGVPLLWSDGPLGPDALSASLSVGEMGYVPLSLLLLLSIVWLSYREQRHAGCAGRAAWQYDLHALRGLLSLALLLPAVRFWYEWSDSPGQVWALSVGSLLLSLLLAARLAAWLARKRKPLSDHDCTQSWAVLRLLMAPWRWIWGSPPIEAQTTDASGQHAPSEPTPLKGNGGVQWGNLIVRNIMRERNSIVAVEPSMPLKELVKLFKQTAYSRLPVYEEDLDHILGIIYAKDLLDTHNDTNWQPLMRPAFFVPETQPVELLFRELQVHRTHFAVVVNEYGETQGIVTMEDILEELVGEIRDEFEKPLDEVHRQINERTFVFEGRASLNNACRMMGIDVRIFEQARQESDSIGGLMMTVYQGVPPVGTELEIEGIQFKVLSGSKLRILTVQVVLPEGN